MVWYYFFSSHTYIWSLSVCCIFCSTLLQEERLRLLQQRIGVPFDGSRIDHQVRFNLLLFIYSTLPGLLTCLLLHMYLSLPASLFLPLFLLVCLTPSFYNLHLELLVWLFFFLFLEIQMRVPKISGCVLFVIVEVLRFICSFSFLACQVCP